MASESAATILCTSKQTRFHIESPNYRELDIEGLDISITSSGKPTHQGKTKTEGEGVELLSNAKLRLKGARYALVGKNGTGKSTLLKAIAEKLIPGIPEGTRIAILQQSRIIDKESKKSSESKTGDGSSVLEGVIEHATTKQAIDQEIKILSDGIESSDPYAAVRALRQLKHHRQQQRLFRLDKDARLRSGTRGFQARKVLLAQEKLVRAAQELLEQSAEDILPESLQAETQEFAETLVEIQLQADPAHVAEIESNARRILTGLGFTEADMAKPIASLSGGWHMRAALATALLQKADILILDEPTNFLDLLGIIWLQRYLEGLGESEHPPTVILVSHDRDFIMLCTDLIILKDKQLTYFHSDLTTYESSQTERRLWLVKIKEAQDKQKAHIEKSIQNNIKAGKARGRFKLSRDIAVSHLSTQKQIDIPPEDRPVIIAIPEPPDLRFPGPLVSLEKSSFRYAPSSPFKVEAITLSVNIGDRVGILGLNGAGKSTLIKLLTGESSPTSGNVTTHPRLKLGYYSQHAVEAIRALGSIEPDLTALGLLTREVRGVLDEGDLRGLLGQLGLPGRLASGVSLIKLSGGQVVRCQLARLLWKRPHCLILDEVTTHLDYETVSALREALHDWEGAVILVSHDRWFMRGVVEGAMEADDNPEDEEDKDIQNLRRRDVYCLMAGKLVKLENGVDQFERITEKQAKRLLMA
ncbi:P-loop containing nucleoside triphosphate hydrolase protein [Fusarium oxysporum II5]|nr:P-loop containing nucleoside triphosphate hydrolase protein [Fusarium oxysporum II5]